jgi:hypothetical protein
VSLTEVKLKVGEILAECGTQEAEKACKWFLLWHNRWAQKQYISDRHNRWAQQKYISQLHNNSIFTLA